MRSTVVLGVAAAAAVGLGAVTIPAIANSEPQLPEVSAQELVSSVLRADSPAFGGTVEVDNRLGLPEIPGLSGIPAAQLLTAESTSARLWADGDGRARVALPTGDGEQVAIEDGSTLWVYDSGSLTAQAFEHGEHAGHAPESPQLADPTQAARTLLDAVRATSTVSVDGTSEVAGRPAYDLVLTPAPDERTLLREVRVAVDAEQRVPMQATVLTNGTQDPAFEVGFTEFEPGAQDEQLFRFSPPEGVTVERHRADERSDDARDMGTDVATRVLGEGWDTVLTGELPSGLPTGPRPDAEDGHGPFGPDGPADAPMSPQALLDEIGEPASGAWGNGWVIGTNVFTVLVTDDGRFAVGAVPRQVLEEALTR